MPWPLSSFWPAHNSIAHASIYPAPSLHATPASSPDSPSAPAQPQPQTPTCLGLQISFHLTVSDLTHHATACLGMTRPHARRRRRYDTIHTLPLHRLLLGIRRLHDRYRFRTPRVPSHRPALPARTARRQLHFRYPLVPTYITLTYGTLYQHDVRLWYIVPVVKFL